ncbi:MAG TPA: class I SAM-dependent methyltransferase [Fimbriimonadaceae bacterium]|nr:class I SAM-dependent methyltransferase [Fimbriimonadaceae bacterium]
MRPVPYRMWVSYYLLLLAHQQYKPKTILDVCCGTGTMCELLTDEGFALSGFDISPGMIQVAREKAARKELDIRYEVFDAAEVDMGETYDAAFSFFDSLNNILDPDRLQMAFDRIFEHLNPGGSFIFDLNSAYAFEQKMFDQANMRANAKLKYKWVGDYDPKSRIITVDMRFWRGGEEFTEVHTQRAYSEEEIRSMLAQSGFEEVRSFTSYTLNPPRYTSDRLHFAAMKP